MSPLDFILPPIHQHNCLLVTIKIVLKVFGHRTTRITHHAMMHHRNMRQNVHALPPTNTMSNGSIVNVPINVHVSTYVAFDSIGTCFCHTYPYSMAILFCIADIISRLGIVDVINFVSLNLMAI